MTVTQNELQELANLLAVQLKLGFVPQVEINKVKRGRARLKTFKITIPEWTIRQGCEYAYYYTIHEVCHFRHSNHLAQFKRLERRLLKQWGLTPVYKKAYPRELKSAAGMPLWTFKKSSK